MTSNTESTLFTCSEEGGDAAFQRRTLGLSQSVSLALITSLIMAAGGLHTAGSYLVDPVYRSCHGWGQSATVIGEAFMTGTIGVCLAVFGPFVRHLRIRTLFFLAILCQTTAFGISAATVAKCEENVSFTRIVYIASFCLLGLANVFCFFGSLEFTFSLFPRRIGIVTCLVTTAVGVGSLAWSQFFLAMEKYTDEGRITFPTVLLLCGVITVVVMSPGLCFSRSQPLVPSTSLFQQRGRCAVVRSGTYYILFFLRVLVLVPAFGLLTRQKTFLKALWPLDTPIVALALVAQLCYTISRFPTLLADHFSATTLLVLDFGVGAICIGLLPSLLGNGVGGIITYGLYSFLFGLHQPLMIPVAGELFGSDLATEGTGLLGLAYGVGGIIGPLTMEAMYYHSEEGFLSFLYLSCGLAFLGYLGLVLVLLGKGQRHHK